MKIIFLGFGEIGVQCLNELIKNHFNIVGVVPRSSDLGDLDHKNSVRYLAKKNSLPIYNHDDIKFLSRSDEHKDVDFLISVQYDRILRNDWLELPTKDTLNIHFSLLPRLRGCYPTKWAIIEEKETGVTLHSIDLGIDSGDILDQISIPISSSETDESLYHKLTKRAFELFRRNISNIQEGAFPKRTVQNQLCSTYHPKELPFDGILECSWELDFCERFLRAFYFPPFPPALFMYKKILIGFPPPCKTSNSEPGTIGDINVTEDRLLAINCLNGTLFFDRIWQDNRFISVIDFNKIICKRI